MDLKLDWQVNREIQELENRPDLILRMGRQVVEYGHKAAFPADDLEESSDVLPQLPNLFVIQQPGVRATARDFPAPAPLPDSTPGAFEAAYGLVAVIEVAKMQRRQHFKGIANGDDETRVRPDLEGREQSLRRVQIGDRAIGQHWFVAPVPVEPVEVKGFGALEC